MLFWSARIWWNLWHASRIYCQISGVACMRPKRRRRTKKKYEKKSRRHENAFSLYWCRQIRISLNRTSTWLKMSTAQWSWIVTCGPIVCRVPCALCAFLNWISIKLNLMAIYFLSLSLSLSFRRNTKTASEALSSSKYVDTDSGFRFNKYNLLEISHNQRDCTIILL